MSDVLKISARGAFSHAWNDGIDSNIFCATKFKNSIGAFIEALFSGYEISICNVSARFLKGGSHENSVFGKEISRAQGRNIVNASVEKIVGETVGKSFDERGRGKVFTKEKSNNYSGKESFERRYREKNHTKEESNRYSGKELFGEQNRGEVVTNKKSNAHSEDELLGGNDYPERLEVKLTCKALNDLMLLKDIDINDPLFSEENLLALEEVDKDEVDNGGLITLLITAYTKNNVELAARIIPLCSAQLKMSEDTLSAWMFFFLKNNNLSGVKSVLKEVDKNIVEGKVAMHRTDDESSTPLMVAITLGDVEYLKVLLGSAAIDVNRIDDRTGNTPLHFAIRSEASSEVIDVLLSRTDIDINIPNNEKKTPLDLAMEAKNKSLMDKLRADDKGSTPPCHTHYHSIYKIAV